MLSNNAPDNQFAPESFSDDYTLIVDLIPLSADENIFNSFDVYIDEIDLDECGNDFIKFSLETTTTALKTAITASMFQGLLPVKLSFTFTELLEIADLTETDFKKSYFSRGIDLCTKIIVSLIQCTFMWTQPNQINVNESERKNLITLNTPKIFTNSKLEPCPNSIQLRFFKEAIAKKDEWIIDLVKGKFSYECVDSSGYKQVLLLTEGDKDNNYYISQIESLDTLDIKYITLIAMEATANDNQNFSIDGKWLLERTGQDKEVTENKKILTELEKLKRLERRLFKYSSSLLFSWNIKDENLNHNTLPNGKDSGTTEPLFIILKTRWFTYNNSLNFIVDIQPSGWAELNRLRLKHFTFKHQDMFTINDKLYPRISLIIDYITDHLRVNRKHYLKNPDYRCKLTFQKILDYAASKELKIALKNSRKANWLKNKVIDDFKFITDKFGWQFYYDKNINGISFKEFCNRTFEVDLDSEHKNKILTTNNNKADKVKKSVKTKKVRSAIDLSQLSGDKVKAIRKELKMTQAQFGSSLGYDRSTVSKIENGNDSEEFINALIKKYKDIVQKYL